MHPSYGAQFSICVVRSTSEAASIEVKPQAPTTTTLAAMFDQLKHVMSRPLSAKTPSEKHFGAVSPQTRLEKADPSTAFERSGWVYI